MSDYIYTPTNLKKLRKEIKNKIEKKSNKGIISKIKKLFAPKK